MPVKTTTAQMMAMVKPRIRAASSFTAIRRDSNCGWPMALTPTPQTPSRKPMKTKPAWPPNGSR